MTHSFKFPNPNNALGDLGIEVLRSAAHRNGGEQGVQTRRVLQVRVKSRCFRPIWFERSRCFSFRLLCVVPLPAPLLH